MAYKRKVKCKTLKIIAKCKTVIIIKLSLYLVLNIIPQVVFFKPNPLLAYM